MQSNASISLGDWTLDLDAQRLSREHESRALNPKEVAVLQALIDAAPRFVGTQELLERCWPDVVVGDHAVHEVIARLRKALGDNAREPAYIETIPRRGYRLKVSDPGVSPNGADGRALTRTASWASRPRYVLTAVLAGMALLAGGLVLQGRWAREDMPAHVAVLPLLNLSGDPEQDYFGVAVSEEIWNQLSQQTNLELVAPTSSRRFTDTNLDAGEIGRQLNARYLLEGSINRQPGRTRVNVHLIDATTGTHLWSETYDRDLGSVDRIFDLYDDISLQVATALGHVLEEEALIGAPIPRTDNLTAYNLLMEAWYTYRRTNDIAKVLELADRAIEADPGWARAHVVKAWALRLLTDSGQLPSDDGYAAARTQIETAIRLAPDYPHAQVMRATIVLRQEHDFRQAMNVYEEAERLGAPMLHWASDKALLYLAAGHPEEALAVLQRFERLDPMFAEPKVDIARALTYLGRQDEADEKIEAALSLAPRHSFVVNAASLHYLLSGNLAGLIGVQRRAGENAPPWLPAAIELLKGNDEPLRGWLETVNADNDKALYFPAFYTLGDYGKFMEGFEAAMHERSRWLAVPILLQDFPNHWQTLQSWALEDPNLTPDRLERIAAHRALVDRITRKMVL